MALSNMHWLLLRPKVYMSATFLFQIPWRLSVGVPRLLLYHSPIWQDKRLLFLGSCRMLRD